MTQVALLVASLIKKKKLRENSNPLSATIIILTIPSPRILDLILENSFEWSTQNHELHKTIIPIISEVKNMTYTRNSDMNLIAIGIVLSHLCCSGIRDYNRITARIYIKLRDTSGQVNNSSEGRR